MASFPPNEDSA